MKKGFTLIELLVVIVIIGAVATLVLPGLLSIEYTKKLEYKSSLKSKQDTFIPYEPRKSIISKRSRRDSFLILNKNKPNNFDTIKRNVMKESEI